MAFEIKMAATLEKSGILILISKIFIFIQQISIFIWNNLLKIAMWFKAGGTSKQLCVIFEKSV